MARRLVGLVRHRETGVRRDGRHALRHEDLVETEAVPEGRPVRADGAGAHQQVAHRHHRPPAGPRLPRGGRPQEARPPQRRQTRRGPRRPGPGQPLHGCVLLDSHFFLLLTLTCTRSA